MKLETQEKINKCLDIFEMTYVALCVIAAICVIVHAFL